MTNNRDDSEHETESNYSGKLGERNRNTPGRTPRELGLDPESDELKAHDIIGSTSDRLGDVGFTGGERTNRKNPDLTPDVASSEGAISSSGGGAGGARGNAGTSDRGTQDPPDQSRGGPRGRASSSD